MHALKGFEARGLVLTSPFYTPNQLSGPVRLSIRRPRLSKKLLQNTPTMLVESAILFSDRNGLSLPEGARRQMAEDFQTF
ncbi:MAG: hypothetical protein HC806_02210 [Anaerolineae bacterium]|nr:hypothetical protein [Anaerolineae bacterium]